VFGTTKAGIFQLKICAKQERLLCISECRLWHGARLGSGRRQMPRVRGGWLIVLHCIGFILRTAHSNRLEL